jgi:hypothetical protein
MDTARPAKSRSIRPAINILESTTRSMGATLCLFLAHSVISV